MNPVLKNILAVIVGIVAGSALNMALVMLGPSVIPYPDGVDVSSSESLAENMHLFSAKHFIFPFLAHALGTLLGAILAGWLAASKKMLFAMIIGVFFLAGGIANVFMIPAPIWFVLVDLILAYIPMAFIAGKLLKK